MNEELNKQLIRAVKIGYWDGVLRLLVEGADPKWKDKDGASAINWAYVLSSPSGIINALEAVGRSYTEEKENKAKTRFPG